MESIKTNMELQVMNNNTINFYNEHVEDFAQDTIEAKMTEVQDRFIKHLAIGSHILDLGCGSGRDSLLFLNRGFIITALDGSKELCNSASKLIGQDVICKTFDEINYEEEFDGVWACASLLHVPSTEMKSVIGRVIKALKPWGVFYASFKYGEFEGDRKGRFYTDLTEDAFVKLICKFNEVQIVELWISGDVRPGREEEKWLNAILIKG